MIRKKQKSMPGAYELYALGFLRPAASAPLGKKREISSVSKGFGRYLS